MNKISETEFALVELRYTLAQLQVQLTELRGVDGQRPSSQGRSVDAILEGMMRYESAYQREYARLLSVPATLDACEGSDGQARFQRMRERTIALLEPVKDWTPTLLETVRRHLADDRDHVTQIANRRYGLQTDHAI